MEPSVAAVESNLVDLAGVSLESLRSMDSLALAGSLDELHQHIDLAQESVSNFNPGRYD
ncbi:hypothetical protein BN159_4856 [Streptomyces davaonensis JCM 4913]|uniref:FXSXX-COOH protein n=1 Tax=Streptomyces davaonensis (strain DSM 101723 / JCM 4913 / KCC S-0913 / 768) TaxID=1214101 RepID=K4R835_STRDJ|nr:hypothetical protein BN159_4856 [Streptomyces davaonensis JCM 4913]